ncbi:helix-turn-helix domain-containing protein [Planococcus shenhongbingii]|uniref:Helix-turn-helix domain-containing protein n=1 Tax=Planococcus shenhongbingii TaxID=3058398 RepID=A0ABT8N9U2_9BACL|nr:helix-turn-helix domain-containing protein [Planococcus sp. N017]MDN7244661.1 helix-turn-helix domain-containing protein [Planococcus sp. N017]
MNTEIGWFIRKRRKEMGLSQEALAEKAQVSERTIRRTENAEGAGEGTLNTICEVLNISFQKLGEEDVRTPNMAIRVPNIQSSRDLAHVLINAEHIEINNHIHDGFHDDFEEEWIVDTFVEKCEDICGILNEDAPERNKVLLGILQNELDKLHKRNIGVSGSCTDSLVNTFKVANLSIYKY